LVTLKVSIVLYPIMTDIDTGIRIKEKAHDLFMQYGLRSVSMDDIAGQLGMSKKTIYQFFSDKDELVEAVISEEIERNEKLCEKDRCSSHNAIHEIFLAIDMVVEIFSTMNSSLIFDMHKYHPGAYSRFQQHKNGYLYNTIVQNMHRGIEEGLYRNDLDIDILARYRVECMLLPFQHEFQTAVKHSFAHIEQEIMVHFLFGMASPKGYKMIIKYQQDRLK